jgi:hypothetical protein
LAVLSSRARFKSLKCGRRAGKTTLAIDDLIYGLENDPPGSESIYGALTIGSAKRIMWEPTKQEIRAHKIGWYKLNHNDHTITNEKNDNVVRVYGSETVRELEKPRGGGKNLRRIRWDECGAQRPTYLQYIFQDVLQPMMMDNPESNAWMMGSPGPTPVGFWYDVTDGDAPGWERHSWTARDNPHVDYEQFIKLLFETNGWDEQTPTFRREYLALWEADPARLVFRYHPMRNLVPQLPELAPGDRWVYAIGLDFGVMDATACAVLAWPERFGKGVYVVETWQLTNAPAPSDAAKRIYATWQKYRPQYLIGDLGGLGKGFWAEWNKAYPGIEMRMANKQDKRGGLEFVSNALHIAKAEGAIYNHVGLFTLPQCVELQKQWATLQWDEEREDIAEGQDDHLSDAVMYAWKSSPAFLNTTAEPTPPPDYRGTTWEFRPPARQEAPLESAFAGAFRRRRR